MNRKEFMAQLEKLLADLPGEEKAEALAYYNSYFEDAGEEHEGEILKELESPEKVARTIRADIAPEKYSQHSQAQYSETGYTDSRFEEASKAPAAAGTSYKDDGSYDDNGIKEQNKKSRTWLIVLICTFPLWIGLAAGAFGTLIGLLGALFGIIAGLFGATLALYVAGIASCVAGVAAFAGVGVATGFGFFGAGLFVLALAILSTLGCAWICGRGVPAIFRGLGKLWRRIFHRSERKVAL